MTPDERKMLEDLAAKFAQTPAPPRDPEAEDLIRTKIGSRPDALYLMTQTVLIQNLALQHAQQQIQELQQRTTQPVPAGAGGSFLGGPGAARGGYSQPAQQYGGQQYSAAPPPQYAAPSPSMPSPSGAPSFLRGAAQTAAGVAAGALAFEGIQSLFSHPGYGGGFGGFGGGAGFGGAPREEIIENNYYDTPQQQDASGDRTDYNDQGQNLDAQNVDDQGQYDDNNAQLDNADYDTGGDDGGSFDDNSGGDSFA